MNQKKVKKLRRKAYNEWAVLSPQYKKVISVKKILKKLKEEYKKS